MGYADLVREYGVSGEDALRVQRAVKEAVMRSAADGGDQARSAADHFGHVLGDWFPTRQIGVEASECQECGMRVWRDTRGNSGGEAAENQCVRREGV